jgi:leucyl aminopeptidase
VLTGQGARTESLVREGLAMGSAIGEAVCIAREIANAPANRMSPEVLAAQARAVGKEAGLAVRVLDEAALDRARCEAILTVGAGSTRPPRLIVLTYDPGTGGAPVAVVGKGLVFDTGGLDIKPSASMIGMKMDKCGAAAVIGAMSALKALDVRVPVVAVVPAVENSISGAAYRPSDVIGTRAGKTVEVLSTDAEGRLVLADAIDWVIEKHRPRAIVDLATLTGAVFYALGDLAAASLGTDSGLLARLRESGERTGDRLWELPLWPEAITDVESTVADVRNTGPYGAGTIAGGAFLRKFVGDLPWAHLDIAGVAWNRRDLKIGATGFGTRLLLDLLARWPSPRGRADRRAKGR